MYIKIKYNFTFISRKYYDIGNVVKTNVYTGILYYMYYRQTWKLTFFFSVVTSTLFSYVFIVLILWKRIWDSIRRLPKMCICYNNIIIMIRPCGGRIRGDIFIYSFIRRTENPTNIYYVYHVRITTIATNRSPKNWT